ncbi:MAG: pseudouridine synthase [Gammaproteobacteria bacterium]|nr:pseudouridine synthase [Gammaproteobacteria bacterium]
MARILLFNKPYNVLSQFRDADGRETLADYIQDKTVYPAGRLDRDSEGLLILTDDGRLQHLISHPRHKMNKTYWVQVEGEITQQVCQELMQGVTLKDGPARALLAEAMDSPHLWPRHPPVRYRKHIPTHWLKLVIDEGRNRQVRRMTAAVGIPTLRLIRQAIGDWDLGDMAPGAWREVVPDEEMLKALDSVQWKRSARKPTEQAHRHRSGQSGRARRRRH